MSLSIVRRLGSLLALALTLGSAGAARADGAFPDSFQVLLPADKPNEIVIGTNFGVLVSADAGKSWQWVCEQEIAYCARFYQLAANDSIYAVATSGIVNLGADACGYTNSAGLQNVADAFIDPNDPMRVLAIASAPVDGNNAPQGLFLSSDGGKSFGDPIYVAADDSSLQGVEIAKSDSSTVYLTLKNTNPTGAVILRSTGGGAYQAFDQTATLGTQWLRIAAVDPADATRIYFRATDDATGGDSLVISSDGGQTTRVAQALPSGYVMSAFLRQADGTLLVAGLQLNQQGSKDCYGDAPYGNGAPVAYKSTDGGQTFAPWNTPAHLRGLGERGGKLYATADNFADGFAVGVSSDGGASWTPLLKYVDIQGPLTCSTVANTCAVPWETLATTFGIPSGGGDGGTTTTSPGKHKSGCDYDAGRVGRGSLGVGLLLALALLGLSRRRRA